MYIQGTNSNLLSIRTIKEETWKAAKFLVIRKAEKLSTDGQCKGTSMPFSYKYLWNCLTRRNVRTGREPLWFIRILLKFGKDSHCYVIAQHSCLWWKWSYDAAQNFYGGLLDAIRNSLETPCKSCHLNQLGLIRGAIVRQNSSSIRIKEELSGLPTGSVYLNLNETSLLPLFSIFHFWAWRVKVRRKERRGRGRGFGRKTVTYILSLFLPETSLCQRCLLQVNSSEHRH